MNNYNPELLFEALKDSYEMSLEEVFSIYQHLSPDSFNPSRPLDSMGMQTEKLPID